MLGANNALPELYTRHRTQPNCAGLACAQHKSMNLHDLPNFQARDSRAGTRIQRVEQRVLDVDGIQLQCDRAAAVR